MLTLEARLRQRQARQRRYKANDFRLRDLPLAEPYVLSTGATDRYLERLRKIHGDQGSCDQGACDHEQTS